MSNFTNNDPDENGVKDALRGICRDSENGDELFFDPATGELSSTRAEDDPDRVPATQMAREGFFLRESDAALARRSPNSEPPTSGAPTPAEMPGVPLEADTTLDGEPEELVFNGETGELQATIGVEATDRVPATQMAREGFFGGRTG